MDNMRRQRRLRILLTGGSPEAPGHYASSVIFIKSIADMRMPGTCCFWHMNADRAAEPSATLCANCLSRWKSMCRRSSTIKSSYRWLRRTPADIFCSTSCMKRRMSVWRSGLPFWKNWKREIIEKNGHMNLLICITEWDWQPVVWRNVMSWFSGLVRENMS